jgi:hypothetical protein
MRAFLLHSGFSLKRQLLVWLLLPQLVLWLMGGILAFRVALIYAEKAIDQSLTQSVLALARQVKPIGSGLLVDFPRAAQAVLEQDPKDRLAYMVSSPPGSFLLGNGKLPGPPNEVFIVDNVPTLYEITLDGKPMRVASMELSFGDGPAVQRMRVQVAKSLAVQEAIASELVRDVLSDLIEHGSSERIQHHINEILGKKKEANDAATALRDRVYSEQGGEWRNDDTAKFDELCARAEAFQAAISDEDIRNEGGEFPTIRLTGTQANGRTYNKGLTIILDNDSGGEDPAVQQRAITNLRNRLLRTELYRLEALLEANDTATTPNWGSSNTAADPDGDLMSAINLGGDARGIDCNTVLYGGGAWVTRFLSLGIGSNAARHQTRNLTPDQLAQLLMVDRLAVAKFRRQSAAST